MENMDAGTEKQVWDRVFARSEQARGEELRSLLLAAVELAANYRYLAGILTGKAREWARGLYEGELENIRCLKGIGILSGSREEVLKIWNPSKEPAKRILEKCYHRTRRCRMEYMARAAEPEFGVVFQSLADREARHCCQLAQLLGTIAHNP